MNAKLQTVLLAIGILFLAACEPPYEVTSNDWPQYQRDNYRSAASSIHLDVQTLAPSWHLKNVQEPSPAWFGPAKWDGYSGVVALPSMRNYDPVYHPVVVNGKLYYGSTADDGLHCLDVKTGKELWVFPTHAPIRIAPTYHQGKLYFGADDGYAYCIDAENGKLKWKFSPTAGEKNVIHNDRIISKWPIRTGVIVEEGTAYFAASMLPWHTSYVCALDAQSGKPTGEGRYVLAYEDLSIEGPIVSSGEKIIIPQGRISPLLFDRKTGEKTGALPGSGGCFVLVTPEKNIIHNPTSKKNLMVETGSVEEPSLLSYEHGKAIVIAGDTAFILADRSISAFHRKKKKTLWVNKKYGALSIIKGGNALYVGGVDTVYAVSPENGSTLWKQQVRGNTFGLALADSALFASTTEGYMYCFRPGGSRYTPSAGLVSDLVDTAALKVLNAPRLQKAQEHMLKAPADGYKLLQAPYANFVAKDKAVIKYTTAVPTPTVVRYGIDELDKIIQDDTPKTHHEVTLAGLRKNYSYNYQIEVINGEKREYTRYYELDNFFNHYKFSLAGTANPYEDDPNYEKVKQEVKEMMADARPGQGSCVVFGFDNGLLAYEVARQSPYFVIAIEAPDQVEATRRKLLEKGIYGKKISVWPSNRFDVMPTEFANRVVAGDRVEEFKEQIASVVVPRGQVILRSGRLKDEETQQLFRFAAVQSQAKTWSVMQKPRLEGSGVWSHQYGQPDNSAFGGEEMWGATTTSDFHEQWIGRPGPRFQSDRSGRKTSPLAINGRLFVQGLERIAAMDSYNGAFLWTNSLPNFMRFNVPRDCSNWSADEDYLYTAVDGYCHQIDAASGEIAKTIDVLPASKNYAYDWGYVANVGSQLIGSAVRKGNIYMSFTGGAGWYDAVQGELTNKVSSDHLFSLDKTTSKVNWKYQNGLIINPTIAIGKGKVYFVETRDKKALRATSRRVDLEKVNHALYMVALDLQTGQKVWEQKLDVKPGVSVFFLIQSGNQVVISSSYKDKYYIYTYDADNGSLNWTQDVTWYSNHHGGHMSKPAITGNKLIMKPAVFDYQTGKRLPNDMPKGGHGCGSYATTSQSVFYRGGSVTMWNAESNDLSKWDRLRPDCWISTIPADGMILSPEGGGGCSCGSWLETSIAFAPKSRAPLMFDSKGASQYVDSLEVKIVLRKGQSGTIRYTLDGSTPDRDSPLYKGPVTLRFQSDMVAGIFSPEGELKEVRRKSFKRLFPSPQIRMDNEVTQGSVQVFLDKEGQTGDVYYTLDGTQPTTASTPYTGAIAISEPVTLTAITFWKDHNGETITSKPTTAKLEVPELKKAVTPEGLTAGLNYAYYHGTFKSVKDMVGLNSLKEGTEPTVSLEPRLRDENYGLRFTGYVKVPKSGVYTFATVSDDGSTVTIAGERVVDADGSHGAKMIPGKVALEAGLHPIQVDYIQGSGGQVLSLHYEGPGVERQEVPAEALFYQDPAQVQ